MISSADYEAAATHTVELAGVKAGAEALADTTAAATAAAAAIAELVKQTKEPDQWTTRQMPASREMAGAPSPQQAGPKRDATGDAGQERENLPPPDRVIHAEKAAAKAGVKPDDQPAEGGSTEQPPAGPRRKNRLKMPPALNCPAPGAIFKIDLTPRGAASETTPKAPGNCRHCSTKPSDCWNLSASTPPSGTPPT